MVLQYCIGIVIMKTYPSQDHYHNFVSLKYLQIALLAANYTLYQYRQYLAVVLHVN